MSLDVLPFAIAHHMALVPLFWLIVKGERRREWWWIAAAFAVSWVADTAAHWVSPWLISTVYPVTQAAIVIAVLADREEAQVFLGLLVAFGLVTVLTEGVTGPTILLETAAAGCVIGVVWPLPLGRLRLSLLVAFGGGLLAWIAYVIAPGLLTWGLYQIVRAVSLGLFCWASWKPHPVLTLAR